jgi:hypothetical protein
LGARAHRFTLPPVRGEDAAVLRRSVDNRVLQWPVTPARRSYDRERRGRRWSGSGAHRDPTVGGGALGQLRHGGGSPEVALGHEAMGKERRACTLRGRRRMEREGERGAPVEIDPFNNGAAGISRGKREGPARGYHAEE